MTKLMNRKLTKKGFTLAELLIVVAIIAILVAIAAPLFVGALDEANESVRKANIRAVKSAAIAKILLNPTKYQAVKNEGTDPETSWEAHATVSNNGEISWTKDYGTDGIKTGTESSGDSCKRQDDGSYTVVVIINDLDITAST